MRLLNLDSRGEKIVGIQGIGGMGKTTIAKAVYDNICAGFNRCCFLENTRELLTKNDGIVSLQNKLISRILRDEVQVKNASEGVNMIREKVCKYKVLVVLDDVDDKFEFDQILGKLGDYSFESRFILTTRDKRVLELLPECKLYEPKEMSHAHSVHLFSRHAFGMQYIPEGYGALCDEFVKVGAKLPLALKLIGSLLFRRDRQFWEDQLMELKDLCATNNKVQASLKISYDDLSCNAKNIFLDIACFFIGEDKELPFHMWSDCKRYPESGLRTLVLRSLIKVDERNQFWMHDLVRDLGRAIVIEEDVKNPCKRSRIWSYEDAMNVLKTKEGTDQVEMLKINMLDDDSNQKLTVKTFEKLARLKYLDMEFPRLTGDFSGILPDMRWLRLRGCQSLPTDLNLEKVVILDLEDCWVTDDWRGWSGIQVAHKLKVINLRGCYKLHKVPNLTQCENLEFIDLTNCFEMSGELRIGSFWNLKVVRHPWSGTIDLTGDMGKLQKLQEINTGKLVSGAQEIVLPTSLKCVTSSSPNISNLLDLKDLEELCFVHCDTVPEIPRDIWQLTKLKTLQLVLCFCNESLLVDKDGTLPPSLTSLIFKCCKHLNRLPNVQQRLKISYNELTHNEKQIFLDIACFFVGEDKESPIHMWSDCKFYPESGLRTLVLRSLIKINERNQFWMHDLLRDLGRAIVIEEDVENPSKRSRIWSSEDAINMLKYAQVAHNLKVIDLTGCFILERVPELAQCESLESIDLTDCSGMRGELDIGGFRNLKVVRFPGTEITDLTGDMGKLQKLQEIKTSTSVWKAQEIVLPTDVKRLTISSPKVSNLLELKELEELRFMECDAAPVIPGGIWQLTKLKTLELYKCKRNGSLLADEEGTLPSSLNTLNIHGRFFRYRLPNLANLNGLTELRLTNVWITEIRGLGELRMLEVLVILSSALYNLCGLENLVNLKELTLQNCRRLESLPSLSTLVKLHSIEITKCRVLSKIQGLGGLRRSGMKNLRQLDVSQCSRLTKVVGLDKLEELRGLNMCGCESIKKLPDMSRLKNLMYLNLKGCIHLKDVKGLEKLKNLGYMEMEKRLKVKHYLKSATSYGKQYGKQLARSVQNRLKN
ncbi:Disease resistance protein L6 [Linum grandiflorum]